MSDDRITMMNLAEAAYLAFHRRVHKRGTRSNPIEWEMLSASTRSAWRQAAAAVKSLTTEATEDAIAPLHDAAWGVVESAEGSNESGFTIDGARLGRLQYEAAGVSMLRERLNRRAPNPGRPEARCETGALQRAATEPGERATNRPAHGEATEVCPSCKGDREHAHPQGCPGLRCVHGPLETESCRQGGCWRFGTNSVQQESESTTSLGNLDE